MEFKDRLNAVLIQKALTNAELARLTGFSRQAVSFWRSGRNVPNPAALKKIADFLGVDAVWLSTGVGEAPAILSNIKTYETGQTPPSGFVAIKEYRLDFSAGVGHGQPEWVEEGNTDEVWYRESFFRNKGIDYRKCRRVRVIGDSMEPTVCDGDHVMIVEEPDPHQGCVHIHDGSIYTLAIDDSLKIKRLARVKDGITVTSDNAAKYPPEKYTGEECDRLLIYGRVIEITRTL